MIFWLSSLLIAGAFIFGGGTRAGFLGDVFVQFLAIPVLLAGWWSWGSDGKNGARPQRSESFLLMVATILFAALLFVQLVSLPSVAWLHGLASHYRPQMLEGIFAGEAWQTISLTPTASWAAAVSMIPPYALFVTASQLDAASRFKLTAVVIGVGAIGLFVGFLQVVQGSESYLRFFKVTNSTEAVGFFANRNHFAAQLYTMLIFAAVWLAFTAADFIKPGAMDTRAILWFAAAAALLIATLAGLALARSRAGIFLAMAAMTGIVALFFMSSRTSGKGRRSGNQTFRRLSIAALCLAVIFAAQFGFGRVMTRFEKDPLRDLRVALTPATFKLALENLPFGTGLGSFVPVYANVEKNEDLFEGYANRAHNDWAELLLETGVFGAGIIVLFLLWFTARAKAIWRRAPTQEMDHHLMLQRGATLVIALLLVHSLMDYPLRTTSIATLFAFACAILIQPPDPKPVVAPTPKRSPHRRTAPRAAPPPPPQQTPQRSTPETGDNEWAEAWKKSSEKPREPG